MPDINTKTKVEAYARALREIGVFPSALYLFGSRAKGTAHKDSDIDVAVIWPEFDGMDDEKRLQLWRARRGVDLSIEPHGFTPEDFENVNDPLVYEIKTTGLRIC